MRSPFTVSRVTSRDVILLAGGVLFGGLVENLLHYVYSNSP